jgi:hypothetical protein
MEHYMSALEVKELSHPAGEVLKIAVGKTLDLHSQGSVTMPAGSTLQMVSGYRTTSATTTSNTLNSTGFTASITPKAIGSKLHVQIVTNVQTATTTQGAGLAIFLGATNLHGEAAYGIGQFVHSAASGSTDEYFNVYIDAIYTTTSLAVHNFELYFRVWGGTDSVRVNRHAGFTQATIVEYAQ